MRNASNQMCFFIWLQPSYTVKCLLIVLYKGTVNKIFIPFYRTRLMFFCILKHLIEGLNIINTMQAIMSFQLFLDMLSSCFIFLSCQWFDNETLQYLIHRFPCTSKHYLNRNSTWTLFYTITKEFQKVILFPYTN